MTGKVFRMRGLSLADIGEVALRKRVVMMKHNHA